MELIYCLECKDIFNVVPGREKTCTCGKLSIMKAWGSPSGDTRTHILRGGPNANICFDPVSFQKAVKDGSSVDFVPFHAFIVDAKTPMITEQTIAFGSAAPRTEETIALGSGPQTIAVGGHQNDSYEKLRVATFGYLLEAQELLKRQSDILNRFPIPLPVEEQGSRLNNPGRGRSKAELYEERDRLHVHAERDVVSQDDEVMEYCLPEPRDESGDNL